MNDLIQCRNVEKIYGNERVICIDNFTMKEGQKVLFTGSNGSGKSSFLRILAGISPVDKGEMWRDPSLLNQHLGFLPQNGGFYPELSIKENFDIRCQLYGIEPRTLKELWYVKKLGLDEILNKRFRDLSGGFQRIATLCATLLIEPRWLILDEPFSGVDQFKSFKIIEVIQEFEENLRLLCISAPSNIDSISFTHHYSIVDGHLQ